MAAVHLVHAFSPLSPGRPPGRIFCETVAPTGVQQRVCECTRAQVFARCVYGPLRSAPRLMFHVTFSAASGHSEGPLVRGRQASKTFCVLK